MQAQTLPEAKDAAIHYGFSLVELSIVLVILGLLTGGILGGQSLIRAAELRSVSVDMSRHMTAVYTFRDKYFALPGDMANATAFWGTDPDGCPTHTNRIAKTQTCNGDGNGQIGGNASESFRAWQQLAAAGLIEGSYTGVTGPSGTGGDHDPGINAPRLRIGNNTGASIYWVGTMAAGDPIVYFTFGGDYGNVITYGMCGGWDCIEGVFKPEEAWNIDTKLDDGRPAQGRLVTRPGCTGSGCHEGCNSATDNSAAAAATATYLLANTTNSCGFYYRNQ